MEFEITRVNIAYTILGGFLVSLSLVSLFLRDKIYTNEAAFALVFGLLIGPHGLGIFDPRGWMSDATFGQDTSITNRVTFELTRVALGIGLFVIGVELPKSYLRDHARSLIALVVPVMAWGWFLSAGFICWIFPALSYTSALVIAACLTPTDPVLANAIVSGRWAERNVARRIRLLLAAESAANDGLAYPFLYISIKMVTESTQLKDVVRFIWESVVYQVLLGVVIGTSMGWLFRLSLRHAEDKGSAVSWDGHFNEKSHESEFSNIIEVFFNCACFVYIGAWLPFEALKQDIDPHLGITIDKMLLLFGILLVVRRMPALIGLWWAGWLEPDVKTLGEALFGGHFGPMGVGAIFISMLALTELPVPRGHVDDQVDCVVASIQPIVSFVVLGSIFVHGLSIPLFSFGSWLHLTYVKAKREAHQAQETVRSASPSRRSRILPDERRGLLSDEQRAGKYSVRSYNKNASHPDLHPVTGEVYP